MSKSVLHVFGIMNRGGAEMRTLSTMREMAERGINYDFLVLSGQAGVLDDDIRRLGGEVHYCPLGAGFVWRFFKLLRSRKYDVVHSHVALVSGFILLVAWLARVPLRIAHFRSTHDAASTGKLRQIRNVILRAMLKGFAGRIVGVSRASLKAFWGKDWERDSRFRVIYNGFPEPAFRQSENFWSELTDDADNKTWIVNVARMDEPKNHPRMAEIFVAVKKVLPQARMVLIGKENPAVRARMNQILGDNQILDDVLFLGEKADVMPFLMHADLMLFPSKWEGFPGAVMEAASVGLPVIASDIPALEEISARLPGVQVVSLEAPDKEWAEAIHRIATAKPDKALAREVFSASDFLLSNNIKQLYAIYSDGQ